MHIDDAMPPSLSSSIRNIHHGQIILLNLDEDLVDQESELEPQNQRNELRRNESSASPHVHGESDNNFIKINAGTPTW